jgi:outer membrane protein W
MKTTAFTVSCIIITAMLSFNSILCAEDWPTTGIGLRFSHWNVKDKGLGVEVYNHYTTTEVDAGGYGGAIYFFSRISQQLFIEFTIGAIGTVEKKTHYWNYEEVKSNAVVPILFGLRYNLLPRHIKSVLQPYGEAGIGAYLINDIHVENTYYYDSNNRVSVKSNTRPGGYIGAGLNFMLSKKFAINYDMRYHMVDFNTDEYQNGIEFGFGCSLMWGK